jgi:hypothetical protein
VTTVNTSNSSQKKDEDEDEEGRSGPWSLDPVARLSELFHTQLMKQSSTLGNSGNHAAQLDQVQVTGALTNFLLHLLEMIARNRSDSHAAEPFR